MLSYSSQEPAVYVGHADTDGTKGKSTTGFLLFHVLLLHAVGQDGAVRPAAQYDICHPRAATRPVLTPWQSSLHQFLVAMAMLVWQLPSCVSRKHHPAVHGPKKYRCAADLAGVAQSCVTPSALP